MAWTAPRTWAAGEVLTGSLMNTHVRDNELALSTHVHSGAAGDGASSLGPLVLADFTTAAAPAAPGAGKGRYYVLTGDLPGFRSGAAGTAHQLATLAGTEVLTNKTLTSPVINTGATGTGIGTGAGQIAAGDHTHAAPDYYPHNPGASGVSGTIAAASAALGDFPVGEMSDAAKRTSTYTGRFAAAPTAVYVTVVPIGGSGNMAWYTTTDFAAVGEAYNANSDSQGSDGTPQTTAVTASTLAQIDVTDSFTGATAGDYFGLVFTRDGDDAADTVGAPVMVLGLTVVY